MRRFAYWRDPLFLVACTLYALNRWGFKPHVHSPFIRGQFDDCLLIPCALPLVLWLQRWLGLRRHDAVPTIGEISSHLLLWTVLFELIGPRVMNVTGDPLDVLAYLVGGAFATIWWHRPRPRTFVG